MELGGGVDFEEAEESELDVVGAWNAGWSAPGGGDESHAGQGGEDVSGGGPGGTAFGVEADHGALWGDSEADLTFDETEDEQRHQMRVMRPAMRRLFFRYMSATASGPLKSP